MEQVLAVPVGVLNGEHEITGAVGIWFVKVRLMTPDVADVPPCPSAAVALALTLPGVARLYVVLVPVAAPVRLALDQV